MTNLTNLQAQNQKGQVLLFVVVTMTIALALGVGISLETLSSLSNISDTDTSQRALAGAEGAVERVLALTDTQLAGVMAGTIVGCTDAGFEAPVNEGDPCRLTIEATDGADVTVTVDVATFNTNNDSDDAYEFYVAQNEVKEVSLVGYSAGTVRVCWDEAVDIYYHTYTASAESKKGIVLCAGGNCSSGWDIVGHDQVASSSLAGPNCVDAVVPPNSLGIRLRPFKEGANFSVSGIGQALPTQGYRIHTQAFLTNEDTDTDKLLRSVTAYKSNPYAPGIFDFAIYAGSSLSSGPSVTEGGH